MFYNFQSKTSQHVILVVEPYYRCYFVPIFRQHIIGVNICPVNKYVLCCFVLWYGLRKATKRKRNSNLSLHRPKRKKVENYQFEIYDIVSEENETVEINKMRLLLQSKAFHPLLLEHQHKLEV